MPVGDYTLIGEGLSLIGESLADANANAANRLMARLRAAKSPKVATFQDALDSLDRLANRPARLAIDADSIYILPAGEDA